MASSAAVSAALNAIETSLSEITSQVEQLRAQLNGRSGGRASTFGADAVSRRSAVSAATQQSADVPPVPKFDSRRGEADSSLSFGVPPVPKFDYGRRNETESSFGFGGADQVSFFSNGSASVRSHRS